MENINDEEPVFSAPVYDAEVAENSPPGTPVITVKATDADKGEFGVVTYSLAGNFFTSVSVINFCFFVHFFIVYSCIFHFCPWIYL